MNWTNLEIEDLELIGLQLYHSQLDMLALYE